MTSEQVYYFRVSADGHHFLPREQAMDTLQRMKYDVGE
jgi:hypothetical protein